MTNFILICLLDFRSLFIYLIQFQSSRMPHAAQKIIFLRSTWYHFLIP